MDRKIQIAGLVALSFLAAACAPGGGDGGEPGDAGAASGLYPARAGVYVGLINSRGEWVVEPAYDYVLDPSEGLLGVREDDLWGYLDAATGATVIPPRFDDAGPFAEGLAPVSMTLLAGFIDTSGQVVIEPRYQGAQPFSEGLAAVKDGGLWGFIDTTGKVVIEPRFTRVRSFSGGRAVFQGSAFGPPEDGGGLSEEEKLLGENGYGYLDREGRMVIAPRFADAYGFVDGLAAAKTVLRDWGFLSPEGEWAIEPRFFEARSFAEGLAAVRVGSKWGYIDRTGQVVIEPQFEQAESFSGGVAAARLPEQRWGYIDRQGKRAITPLYESAAPFRGPLAMVKLVGDRYAYINRRGRTVWEAEHRGGLE